jgi:hypothetical protein
MRAVSLSERLCDGAASATIAGRLITARCDPRGVPRQDTSSAGRLPGTFPCQWNPP